MATKTQPDTIRTKGSGPIIEEFVFRFPPAGGLTVFHGANGAGKSIALDGVNRLLGGDQSLERSDGIAKGSVEGFGVTLTLGRLCRKTGECTITGLSGKYDIGSIIDPEIKDPIAADAKRIKGLLEIRGVGADASRFDAVDGDRPGDPDTLHRILDLDFVASAPDLVEQARRVKARLQDAAHDLENDAIEVDGQAKACRAAAEGVDLDGETDREKLQGEWEAAFANQSVLTERRNAADDGRQAVVTAEAALREAKTSYSGPAYENAHAIAAEFGQAASSQEEHVEGLRAELERAVVVLNQATDNWNRAQQTANLAKQHEGLIAGWQATIDADRPKSVSDDEMNEAERGVSDACKATEQGARIRVAKTKVDEAQRHTEEATEARDEAERLRKAAHATDDVLSKAVASETIQVKDGRLYVPHAKRVRCLVSALSPGERARLAILEVLAAIRSRHEEGPVAIVVPQKVFEALDQEGRELVAETADDEGVSVFTAVCDFGKLRIGGILAETKPIETED